MKRTALTTTLFSAAFALLLGVKSAIACMPIIVPPTPAVPQLDGKNPHAALATPVDLNFMVKNGRRYWRALYDVTQLPDGADPQAMKMARVVVEWACDPDNGDRDFCGDGRSIALPGFNSTGEPSEVFVELNLETRHTSTLDGFPVWAGTLTGTKVLDAIQPARVRGVDLREGGKRFES